MATEIQTQILEKTILETIADDPSLFLVQLKVGAGNNIKVFIDSDQGVTIENCIGINRSIYRKLEEDQVFPADDFSLEVSSPGVGEPLLLHRQYVKNIGRFVEVKGKDGVETLGELKAVGEQDLTIEIVSGKGKKLEIKQQIIAFDNIKSITVQIKF